MQYEVGSRVWTSSPYTARSRARKRSNARGLRLLVCALVLVGIIAQISMISSISSQSRRARELQSEVDMLASRVGNYQRSISEHHNLPYIQQQARMLGLQEADESCVRVVSLG